MHIRSRATNFASLALVLALLVGCAHRPPDPPEQPDGKSRVPVNSPSVIADSMASYYRKLRLSKIQNEPKKATVKVTIKKALQQYVPADIKVYADDAIDLSSNIDYETGKPWAQALGDALTEVDVEMTADLGKRVMTLKPALLTLSKILEKYAPSDFTVYADDNVDMSSLAYFDRSLGWPEALGKALASVNVGSTINLSRKLIVISAKRGTSSKGSQ